MKCPNCQHENTDGARVCSSCGASLPDAKTIGGGVKAVTAGGIALGRKAREARLREMVDPSLIISDTTYNGIIGIVLLWGLLINYILCWKVGSYTNLFPNMSPVAFLIGYAVCAIAGVLLGLKAQNPLVSFLGFNLVALPLGLVLSTLVEAYGGLSSAVVTQAFLYTFLIAVAIVSTVVVFPQAFRKLGGMLGAVLFGLILCEILLLIFHVRQEVTSWIGAGLFSVYLGYDVYRSQQYPKTVRNAVASALDIYLDLVNIFIRLLEILNKNRD